MKRPWLEHYPPGVPAEADVGVFASLKEVFETSCRRFAERPAYSNLGVTLTYAELDRLTRDLGAWFQHGLGLDRGERIAIMLPNLLQYPVVLFAALRAGYTVVNVNPQYTARELEHQLKDSGARVIVVLENFAHTLQEVLDRNVLPPMTVVTTEVGDLFPVVKEVVTNLVVKYVRHLVPAWRIPGAIELNSALREGRELPLDEVSLGQADIAFLQYTGGTTGVAKGVVLTHGNLVANVQQMALWVARDLKDGEETGVIPLPLYHVLALTVNLVLMKIGAHIVLVTNPRDLQAFIGDLERHPFSIILGVNTLYRALLDTPRFAEIDLSRVKVACAGGMAVQRVVAERWKQRAGAPLIEGYGLTETSPVAICNALGIADWTGTIGMPIPSTDAAVLDEDGREVAIGEVGEICIRGPQVMREYWGRPDETAKVFTADGWLRTGDMGVMDERGSFRITDRKKDMIIVSGFKVFPNEVEDVVALHPGVLEVAAIGEPDPKSGEIVKIVVVRRDPALTADALLEHCRTQLTSYKVPRRVEFRTEPLPKSNIGKVLRRALREEAKAAA